MTIEEIRARYPHLIRALQYTAILSQSEATVTLHAYRAGTYGYPEAVAHWLGGRPVTTLLATAWRLRHYVRRG